MAYVDFTRLSGLSQFRFTVAKLAPMLTVATRPRVVTSIRPAIIPAAPLIMPRRPSTFFRPYIATAAKIKALRIGKPSPVSFRPNGVVPPLILQMKRPSGGTYKAAHVDVIKGADPVSAKITGAGAPTTGQDISLKESDPIVAVAATKQGVKLVDEPMPTFVEAAAVAPSPWLKYGLLALGGYIVYDTFVKSQPKKKRRRR